MSNPILLLNTTVQMQNTLGADKTITAISKINEPLITGTHDFAVDDLIVITGVVGMVEINKRVVRVKTINTTVSFVAEGLDASGFSTYVSGGKANKVASLFTFDNLTSFSFPEPAPTRIDVTTIHDPTKKEIFGLDEAVNISMGSIADPAGVVTAALRAASIAKATRVFRVVLQTGEVLIFNAFVAGGRGLDASDPGGVMTAQINMTLAANEQYFAS